MERGAAHGAGRSHEPSTVGQNEGETYGEDQVHHRQGKQGRPHVIRLLVGPTGQQMNRQSHQVRPQREPHILPPPKYIHKGREQGNDGNGQVGQPGLVVPDRRKAEAVVQAAYGDGCKNRHDDGTENRLPIQHGLGRMNHGQFRHRQGVQQVYNVHAASVQRDQQRQHRAQDQPRSQSGVLQIVANFHRQRVPFILQITENEQQHENGIDHVVDDLEPYADRKIIPKTIRQKGHEYGNGHENPASQEEQAKDLACFRLGVHNGK